MKLLLVWEWTRRLWVWRMKVFLMKININNACTLGNSSHIFPSVSGKLPPWKIPPMFLNIPAWVFSFFFFSFLLPLSLILRKRLFCNSMFQKCWRLYVCENLSKRSIKWRKAINDMGGNNPGENFLGAADFPGGNSPERVWWVGIFRVGIPPVERIFLQPFSSKNYQ